MVQKNNKYVYGTAAEKIQYDVYEKNKVLKEKKQYKANNAIKLKMVASILLAFLIGFAVMYRYALIADMNYKISNMERQYEKLKNENSRLKVAIENETNLSRISEIAQNELGMQKPDKYQIVHIRVPKTSYTVISDAYKNTTAKENLFVELVRKGVAIKKLFN
ncbi:MAG TPA: cell division protein FtsL [Clostridiales bacterium]|nr:cell division protein FtsL [Clostridiales bacterium]